MSTLFVSGPDVTIRRVSRRLVVERDGAAPQEARLRELDRVVLQGNVQVTAPAVTALLDAGVETVYLSPSGSLRGRLQPAEGKNVLVRLAQFRRYDEPEFRLRISRSIVDAKIRNTRSLVQHHYWNHREERLQLTIDQLARRRTTLHQATSPDMLRGIEGDAARIYFAAFGGMVRSELAFNGRSRRPPRDPVNALLSFGYTLVAGELAGAAAGQGLDPYLGYFHEVDYGRPSLALDLVEEFRQPVVDRLVLSLINRQVLKADHFERRPTRISLDVSPGDASDSAAGTDVGGGGTAAALEAEEAAAGEESGPEDSAHPTELPPAPLAIEGTFLTREGRERFYRFYHRALESEFDLPDGESRGTYRQLFRRQAGRMRRSIETGCDYEPHLAG